MVYYIPMWRHIIDIVFPKTCIVCKRDGLYICTECVASIPRAYESPHLWVTPLFQYKDSTIKRIIHNGKYSHTYTPLTDIVVASQVHIKAILPHGEVLIIPVPQHHHKTLFRGYNHAAVIAKAIATTCKQPYNDKLIIKHKKTPRQVTMPTRSSRLHNTRNSFSLRHSDQIAGKHCVLVDDVTTTGATLSELRDLLLAHKASSVHAITLAH